MSTTTHEPLLNTKQLAEESGISLSTVFAHKALGYKFQYGFKTTRSHYLRWLKDNPDKAQNAKAQYDAILKARRASGGRPQHSTADK